MLRTLTTLLAVLALALAACGGDDDGGGGDAAATSTPTPTATSEDSGGGGGGGGGGGSIEVAAPEDGSLVFEPDQLTASAGEIEVEFDNPSTVPHAFAIDGQDTETAEITGDSATAGYDLEAGEYTFYCPVAGHREAGMEGTLTVE